MEKNGDLAIASGWIRLSLVKNLYACETYHLPEEFKTRVVKAPPPTDVGVCERGKCPPETPGHLESTSTFSSVAPTCSQEVAQSYCTKVVSDLMRRLRTCRGCNLNNSLRHPIPSKTE